MDTANATLPEHTEDDYVTLLNNDDYLGPPIYEGDIKHAGHWLIPGSYRGALSVFATEWDDEDIEADVIVTIDRDGNTTVAPE